MILIDKIISLKLNYKVVSSLPGRLRVNMPSVKKIAVKDQIGDKNVNEYASKIPGIKEVSVSYVTGNVLIKYDSKETSEKIIKEHLKIIKEISCKYKKELQESYRKKDHVNMQKTISKIIKDFHNGVGEKCEK